MTSNTTFMSQGECNIQNPVMSGHT